MASKNRFYKTKYSNKKIQSISPDLCVLCGLSSNDSYLGQLFSTPLIVVHENCMLFSPLLIQTSDPDKKRNGFIIGYKITDIEREVKRIIPLRCRVCGKNRAGVGCNDNTCRKSFHLSCGIKAGATGLFKDGFQFFCADHSTPQVVNKQLNMCNKTVPECTICLETLLDDGFEECTKIETDNNWLQFLSKVKKRTVIHGLCCARSWMHRGCIRQYALSAGLHHVKCPNCSNKKVFLKSIQQCGIWVPDRDASWELEPGAYHELYDDTGSTSDQFVNTNDTNSVPESQVAIMHNPQVVIVDTVPRSLILSTLQSNPRKRNRPIDWSSSSSPTKPIKRLCSSATMNVTTDNLQKKCPKCFTNVVINSMEPIAASMRPGRPPPDKAKVDRCLSLISQGVPQWKVAPMLEWSQSYVSRIKIKYRNIQATADSTDNMEKGGCECLCVSSVSNDEPVSVASVSHRRGGRPTRDRARVERCLSLVEQGLSHEEIGRMLNWSKSNICKIKSQYADIKKTMASTSKPDSPMVASPGIVQPVGKKCRTRDKVTVERCLSLVEQGLPFKEIGRMLNCSASNISKIKCQYAASKSQKASDSPMVASPVIVKPDGKSVINRSRSCVSRINMKYGHRRAMITANRHSLGNSDARVRLSTVTDANDMGSTLR